MATINLKIKSDFEQAERDFKDLAAVSESTRTKIEKFSKSFESESIDKFAEKNRLAGIAVAATSGKFAGMQTEARGLQREIQRLIKAGMNPQNEALKRLTSDHDKLQKEIAQTTAATNKQSGSFAKAAKSAAIFAAGFLSLRAIGNGLTSIVDSARMIEDATASFQPLLGSFEKAKDLVNELNIVAAETPFQFQDIAKSVEKLLPALNGNVEKSIKVFKMLGDTAGGNAQKLESITRGFSKAMLKGKVDMESLNMIAEAGVPIFTEMAASMGYGKDQMQLFFKEISSGKVSTDELEKAFQRMTGEGGIFFEGMITASKTTSGVLSTMSDNLKLAGAALGQELLPFIKSFALAVVKVAGSFVKWAKDGDNLKNVLSAIGYILAGAAAGFAAYVIASGAAAAATSGFVAAIIALTVAMKANWLLVLVGLLVSALVPAIIWAANNWDKFKFGLIYGTKQMIIGLSEVGIAMMKTVLVPIGLLLEQLAKLPKVGKNFQGMATNVKGFTASLEKGLQAQKNSAEQLRRDFAESQKVVDADLPGKSADQTEAANDRKKASDTARALNFIQTLETMKLSEQAMQEQQIQAATDFFIKRAEMEGVDFETRMEFLKAQNEKVASIRGLNDKQRLMAEVAIRRAIENEEKKLTAARVAFGQHMISNVGSMLTDLQTIFQNAGKESKALAYALKGVAMAEAAINSYLAFTKTLANPMLPFPFDMVAAGIVLAAGLAKQVAIASTPIPSGQTGLEYTVPDTRTNKNDRAPVNASAGEHVSISPRGEDQNQSRDIKIDVGERNLFSILQRGIDTGRIDISQKNITRGVFAT